MTKRTQLQEAFKLALSMLLLYWLALWMDWDMPQYGALAIALISLDTTGASLRKGLMRVIGTTFGLVFGLMAIAWFAQDCWANMLFHAAYLVLFTYVLLGSRYAYAWFVAGYLPSLIWSSTYMHTDSAFHYAVFRYLETTAGVVIYTVVSALIWPRRAGVQLNRQGAELWTGLRKLFGLYRRQLAGGELPDEAGDLRAGLAGTVTQMFATLDTAYADTPSVIAQKPAWEVLRVSTRALGDALELWAQSIDDFRRTDLQQQPGLGCALDTLDKRLERISELWQARQAPDDEPHNGNDAGLLEPLRLELDSSAVSGLARFDRAALMSFRQQLQIVDQASRELLSTLRVLAGLDPSRGVCVRGALRDLYRPSPWQPERLIKALSPAVCFVVAYFYWIYFNPPTGPSIPMMAGIIGMVAAMSGLGPQALGKLLIAMLVAIWVVVAPLYFFVMPALTTGFEILSLIFVVAFILGYLGGRQPVMKSIFLVMFVMMAGISNQQTYSFIGLADSGLMMLLVLGGVPVLQMLVSPTRPEQILMRSLRRFFLGCERILGEFSLYRPEDRTKGVKARKRLYESMVLPVPGQLQAVEKTLEYNLFPDNTPEKVKDLVDNLQGIAFRLQALEIAHGRMVSHSPDLMEPFGPLGHQLEERLQRIFETWARFEGSDPLDEERDALQEISCNLEQRLDTWEETGESDLPDDQASQDLYSMLGGLRGLLGAMEETQNAIRQIHWDQWSEVRF